MKKQHWPAANASMILGSAMLLFPFLFKSFSTLFREFRNGKLISFFLFLFFFNIAIAIIGYTVTAMHWYMGKIFLLLSSAVLIILLFPIVLPFKLSYKEEKIHFTAYLQKIKGNALILFLVLNVVSLFVSLNTLGIGPGYYSLERPPALQKIAEESSDNADERFALYYGNYMNFLDNRKKSQNK